MKKAIVTGATGFIGSWLVKELINQNVFVYAIVRTNSSKTKIIPYSDYLCIVECDMDKIQQLPKKIKDKEIDVIYHLAWQGASGKERSDYSIQLNNIHYSLDLLDVCRKMKINRFIPVGTVGENMAQLAIEHKISSENFVYALSKNFYHTLLKVYENSLDTKIIWCTLSGIYGEGDKSNNLINYTIKTLLKGEKAKYTKAEQLFDFLHVSDCVHALYLIGKKNTNKNEYYIGSGEPRKLKDYLLEIKEIMGNGADLEFGAIPEDGTTYKIEWMNNVDMFKELDFKPEISFKQGIKNVMSFVINELDL